jgi:hypothetical protein
MSAKPKPTKKKTAKGAKATPAAANSRPKRPATGSKGCFVAVRGVEVVVTEVPGKGTASSGPHADFLAARSAVVDGLIEAIEAAERRLTAAKRAETLGELQSA